VEEEKREKGAEELEMIRVLEECQRTSSAHKEGVARLGRVKKRVGEERFGEMVVRAVELVLQVPKKEACVERMVAFWTSCCSAARGRGGAAGVERPETDRSEEAAIGNDVVQVLLGRLLDLSTATDKNVRLRSVQLVGNILLVIPDDGEFLSDAMWDKLEKKMMSRLDDKNPSVRANAVRALERLQDTALCSAGKDPIMNKLKVMVGVDTSAQVRKAALRSIVVTKETLGDIVARTRDVKSDVRACAFVQLAKRVHIKNLSILQRIQLLNDGLKDRSEVVRVAARQMVCDRWVALVDGDPISLLRFLDVEASEEPVLLALRVVLDEAEAQARRGEDKSSSSVVKLASWDLNANAKLALTPEGALFWRARCSALQAQGREDELEALVPDLSSLCKVIELCHEQLIEAASDDSEAKSKSQFVLQQLLLLAASFEAQHDIVGQQNLTAAVTKILDSRLGPDERVIRASFELVRSLNPDDETGFVRQGSSIIFDCFEPLEESTGDLDDEEQDPRSKVDALQTELQQAVQREDFDRASAIKKEIQALEQLPVSVEAWRKERSLNLTLGLLQTIQRPGLIPELRGLMDRIVIPVLQLNDADHLRHAAIKSLALFGQLDSEQAKKHFALFVMVLDADEEVLGIRIDALRGIFDLVMLWGLDALVEHDEGDDEAVDDIMFKLLEYMDSDEASLRLVAAEGFAKLAVVGRLVDVRILQCLVVLYFHPSSESDVRLRQCLAVCFPTLAQHTQSGRQAIQEMAEPLLSTLLQPPADSPLEEVPVEPMLQYMLSLLSHCSDASQAGFAQAVLVELLAHANGGEHVRALARTLHACKLEACSQPQILALQGGVSSLQASCTDGVALRQLEKVARQLENLVSEDSKPTADAAEQAVAALSSRVEERKGELPSDDATAESAKKPRKTRKLKQQQAEFASSEDDEENAFDEDDFESASE
ncbi:Condensin complex subunit 3 (Chromosome-associated protein G) (Condensin subunit CAP-G) (hCAP-G) (Melanoma antigen NY-MEL-3) (Non-SMC condensin I complex subunit G) (XCAP-G homolog), partial [Durusdinium trenchii]